jgi:hypothetical protein
VRSTFPRKRISKSAFWRPRPKAIAGATLTTRDLAGLAADPDRLAHSFEDFIDSAVVVVSARFDRLAAHMAAPDAIDLLSADLEALLPFLP